jgi:hypothetical protein
MKQLADTNSSNSNNKEASQAQVTVWILEFYKLCLSQHNLPEL